MQIIFAEERIDNSLICRWDPCLVVRNSAYVDATIQKSAIKCLPQATRDIPVKHQQIVSLIANA